MTRDEITAIAELSKQIRNDLFRLKELSVDVGMRNNETRSISRTINQLDTFRNKAENFMFTKGRTDINIFYGDSK